LITNACLPSIFIYLAAGMNAYTLRHIAHKQEGLRYDVEAWYDIISDFTFATVFRPLRTEEARAIVNFYQRRYNSRDRLNLADISALRQLQADIATTLQAPPFASVGKDAAGAKSRGAFVRLSARSPKDGCPLQPVKLKRTYEAILKGLVAEGADLEDANTQMVALCKSQMLVMTVLTLFASVVLLGV
jgi:hypothetical protein